MIGVLLSMQPFYMQNRFHDYLKEDNIDTDFCAIFNRESIAPSDATESHTLNTKHS